MTVHSEVAIRSGTTADWADGDDLILGVGELGFNETTREFKCGDGTHTFAELAGLTPKAQGRVVLVAGTKVTAEPELGANDNLIVSLQALGTVAAPKFITVSRVTGVSFTLTSTDNTDTSTFAYQVFSGGV